MSLIADALKKAQAASFGRRYLSPEPSGVLPVARPNQRGTGEGSSPLNRMGLSPTLLIGLGSGLFLFALLFVYFFYGKTGRVQPRSSVSAKTSGAPVLSPPPAVPVVEPLSLEKETALTQGPEQSKESQVAGQQPIPGDSATAKLAAGKEGEVRRDREATSVSSSKRSEGSQLAIASEFSEEVRYHFNLALSYQEEKSFSQAKREYEKVIQLWPLHAEARNNLGVVYKELGMYDEAINEFRKALALNPSYPKAYHNLGVIYQIKGDWKPATKNYEMALSLDRNHLGAYNNLGLVYRSQKQPHEAREILEKALAVNSGFPQTHYNLALTLEEIGETERARFHYQKFIDLSGEENKQLVERVRAHLGALPGKK
jgi:Tfp pilus assembly protein PilF